MEDNELRNKLKPYPFEREGESEIYGVASVDEIHWYGGDVYECTLKIALLNSQMIEYDQYLLKLYSDKIRANNNRKKEYVEKLGMYFYEFSAKTVMSCKFLHEIILEMEYNKCLYGELVFYSKVKLYSEDDCKITDGLEIIEGEILFSASPVLRGKAYLKVIDIVSGKDISKIYGIFNDTPFVYGNHAQGKLKLKVDKVFNKVYSKINCYIYNVGQGNCNYVKFDDVGMFFDIGLTTKDDPNKAYIDKACEEIVLRKTDVVILSHWDLDHILGITLDNHYFNKCIFIAPRFKDIKSGW